MTKVRWTDNICNVGFTCVHGYFTGDDLHQLLSLCPSATFTPTYYHEHFPAGGYTDPNDLKKLKWTRGKTVYESECGYYFTFMEAEGVELLNFLQDRFSLTRGEGCF